MIPFFFENIVQVLRDKRPVSTEKMDKLERLISSFSAKDARIPYNGMVFVPQKATSSTLKIAYDSKTGAQFRFTKSLLRITNFQCGHKAWPINNYKDRCIKYRQ